MSIVWLLLGNKSKNKKVSMDKTVKKETTKPKQKQRKYLGTSQGWYLAVDSSMLKVTLCF